MPRRWWASLWQRGTGSFTSRAVIPILVITPGGRSFDALPRLASFPVISSGPEVALIGIMRERFRSAAGFTLVELLVAMVLTQGIAIALLPMFVTCLQSARRARDETAAVMLAWQKVEQVRAAVWGSAELVPSPPDALAVDAPGFAEVIDARGVPGEPAAGQASRLFVRRWSVQTLSSGTATGVLLHVFVAEYGHRGPAIDTGRRQVEAHVVAVRMRR